MPTTTRLMRLLLLESRDCPSCRAPMPADAVFCRECGKSLKGAATSEAPADSGAQLAGSAEAAFKGATSEELPLVEAEVVVSCANCNAAVPDGVRYCGSCGTAVAPARAGSRTAPMGGFDLSVGQRPRLAVLNADGTLRRALVLTEESVVLGRARADLLLERDPFVAPRHARVRRTSDGWVIEDLRTANGVYKRLSPAGALLIAGDYFRAGRQLMRVASYAELFGRSPPPVPPVDVQFFGSPERPEAVYVCQMLASRRVGHVLTLDAGARKVLGREGGDLTFPKDDFLSARHVQLECTGPGRCQVTDLNSTNGVYLRLSGPAPVAPGDTFCLGETLVRFELA